MGNLVIGKTTYINELMSLVVVTLRGVGVNLVCMYIWAICVDTEEMFSVSGESRYFYEFWLSI